MSDRTRSIDTWTPSSVSAPALQAIGPGVARDQTGLSFHFTVAKGVHLRAFACSQSLTRKPHVRWEMCCCARRHRRNDPWRRRSTLLALNMNL